MTCRDWGATLLPCSFRGVRFEIESIERPDGGRRGPDTSYVASNGYYAEDLGGKIPKRTVTAYVHGDDADVQADALYAVCNDVRGAGLLILNNFICMATCRMMGDTFQADQLGRIAINLEFVPEPVEDLGALPELLLPRLITAAFQTLVPLLTVAYALASRFTGGADFLWQNGADRIVGQAALTLDMMSKMTLTSELAAEVSRDLRQIIRRPNGFLTDTAGFVDYWSKAHSKLFEACVDPMQRMQLAEGLFAMQWYQPPRLHSAFRLQDAKNALAFDIFNRGLLLGHYSEAVVEFGWGDRNAALLGRTQFLEMFEPMMHYVTDSDILAQFMRLRGLVCDHLGRTITTLVPVVLVEAGFVRPASWWAWYLYGDVKREDELVARNGVLHSLYMPSQFEALAA